MKRVSREQKLPRQFIGPAGLDETQVKLLVRPINLVADDWMSEMREVNPDLMRPARARLGADDSKAPSFPNESLFDLEHC